MGSVGAYAQKAEAAARSGIDIFLVPPAGFTIVERIAAERFEVRCVSTFTDAIIELSTFGGNGIEIARDLALPIPEKSDPTIDPNDGYLSCAEAIAENN